MTQKWFSGPMCRICYRRQDRVKSAEKQSRIKKLEHYQAVCDAYSCTHKEQIRTKNADWYSRNKVRVASVKKQYKTANRLHINATQNEYIKQRKSYDVGFHMKLTLRSRLNKAIKNNQKTGSAVKDLGCTVDELKKYLESKFTEGMTWNNYGKWHIDHIKPLASFNLEDRVEFKKACHYTNLQPLWAKDNLEKSNKEDYICR